MSSNNIQTFCNTKPKRSISPDPYISSYRKPKTRRRRHTLPSIYHRSHPYFSQHIQNYKMGDDSIDTTSYNKGITFYQDPGNGEVDFYWDDEICSPSLMPENNEIDEISGDSADIDEKYFQIMAKELNKRRTEDSIIQNEQNEQQQVDVCEENDGNLLTPEEIEMISEQTKDMDLDNTLTKDDIDDMVKEMNEILSDNNLEELELEELEELEDQEQEQQDEQDEEQEESEDEGPPSPSSPRDPEREGPALSEEEEDTIEGAQYRLEHDPEFQDEAGLMYGDDSGDEIWPDDEGMDPMENQ
ncbi:hypothetical protein C1645_780033 [Glomus cerebriforme]|uniref:Transcription factor Iwr1 domain-containing protein n=1 Tax=Glomus cerebriforme TaxID=658196 RepID=A0A397SQC6_9GLOM|nr:hypothetical protein C1645_780033 [Glomus cerebriforme]